MGGRKIFWPAAEASFPVGLVWGAQPELVKLRWSSASSIFRWGRRLE